MNNLQIELTEEQSQKLRELAPIGSGKGVVVGWVTRRPWPDCSRVMPVHVIPFKDAKKITTIVFRANESKPTTS